MITDNNMQTVAREGKASVLSKPIYNTEIVFIVSYCRTPLGCAITGSLSHLSAPELASHAIKGRHYTY